MLEVREAALSDSTIRAKYKRRVNDVYCRMIPARQEFDWTKKTGSITLTASYDTGTLSVSAGGSTLTGSSTVWTTAMTGRKIWISGNDTLYTFTYVSATSGTISPAFTGTDALSGASYLIFQTEYELPSDFDHMTTEPGMWFDYGRGRTTLTWYPEHLHMRQVTSNPSSLPAWMREHPDLSSNGLRQISILPPVTEARVLNFEYFRAYPEMREISVNATTTAGSTTVTTATDISAYIAIGMYFRVNPSEVGGDCQWVKITGISGTTLTVSPQYISTNAAQASTICDAPEYPSHMVHAIFLGTCYMTGLEQNDQFLTQGFGGIFGSALDLGVRREARKRYGKKTMRFNYSDYRSARY